MPDRKQDFRSIDWPENPHIAAMRSEVVSTATNLKALMVGLSLQDGNLQSVFARARHANPWPWPCAPNAQGHVFCENEIGAGQRQMLMTVYAHAYNDHIDEIERSAHLQAWGEQALLALVLKLVADKLAVLVRCSLDGKPVGGGVDELVASLVRLRDNVAALAVGDRTAFANSAISTWSRIVSLFRTGDIPSNKQIYELISSFPLGQVANDRNAKAVGFGELGVRPLSAGVRPIPWTMADRWTAGRTSRQRRTHL